MSTADRLVSVVIPTYYRNECLTEALDSVIDQTHKPVEIIVVDDSGESHALSVVKRYPEVEYIPHDKNRGAQAARNTGLEKVRGDYVNLLDDDDRMRPRKLEKQIELIESNPDVGVVYCGKQWENGHKVMPDSDIRGDVLHHALSFQMTPSSPSAMLIEREILDDIRPLTDRPGGDDLGLKIELARRTAFDFVDEPLLIQGHAGESRGGSMGAVVGRRQILDEYAALYEEPPQSVYRSALAHTYLLEAHILLYQNTWSLKAIKAATLALYYVPGLRLSFAGYALVSLFGRPGRRFGWKIYDRLVLGDEHQGGLT
ncbi:glycosyl transferase [Natronococcus pandeyae]|uniref:Glycosyl transferase n=2 Tax=Natronococcus pandeyae TaxID=2055836 RepID=A0A8J8PZT8_9EURY|nr:glycosyl transferase [Natronococcus pandeyae]